MTIDESIKYLLDNPSVYHHEVQIRTSDTGIDGSCYTHTMMCLCQDAANAHAVELGIDSTSNIAWILSRQSMIFRRYPCAYETITVLTWQSGMDRIGFDREYLFLDEEKKPICHASSYWNIIDISARKLLPTRQIYPEGKSDHMLEFSFLGQERSVRLRQNYCDFKDTLSYPRRIGRSDIDRNTHLNNTRYIALSIDAAAFAGYSSRINRLDINFVSEMHEGASYDICVCSLPPDASGKRVAVKSLTSDGKDNFRAVLTF